MKAFAKLSYAVATTRVTGHWWPEGQQDAIMKSKFIGRCGASVVALATTLALAPNAWADATTDVGPATVTLGGFLAAESAYRERSESADIGSSFSGIPFSNATNGHYSEFRFTARQSRLSVLAQGNVNPDTHLAFYSELDFLGAAQTANSNESNSYNLRIRNVYGTVDWDAEGVELLAGQNWSLATLNGHGITPRNEIIPATIDAQYSVGFTWARQPQIRIVKNFDHQFWLALSAENPQTTFAGGPGGPGSLTGISIINSHVGGSLLDGNNNFSINHVPDIIGKAAWEPIIGDAQPLHVEVYGLYRDFYDRVDVTSAANVLGLPVNNSNHDVSGGGVGGGITWAAIPKILDLQVSGLTGTGIGRYGSGQLPDVTFRPDGTEAPITDNIILLGATWHATPMLDIYTYAGQEAEHPKYFNVTAGAATTHFGVGNPAVVTTGCGTENASCSVNIQAENQINAGFWWKIYQGKFGSFRYGMQYSYTHLTSFAGVGGHAPTDDNMVFTSIRYYPF